jgi:hypothetical protein
MTGLMKNHSQSPKTEGNLGLMEYIPDPFYDRSHEKSFAILKDRG